MTKGKKKKKRKRKGSERNFFSIPAGNLFREGDFFVFGGGVL